MRSLLSAAFLCVAIFMSSALSAQSFEGEIIYGITYENMPPEMEMYKSMMPSTATVSMKGKNLRQETPPIMGNSSANVMNLDMGMNYAIMNMMGQKMYVETEIAAMEREMAKPTITYTKEEKTIQGYKCKSAEISFGGEGEPMVVYYTEKIPNNMKQFGDLKGFPLQYEQVTEQMTIVYICSSVTEKKIDSKLFVVPDGYRKVTEDDLRKMQQGGM